MEVVVEDARAHIVITRPSVNALTSPAPAEIGEAFNSLVDARLCAVLFTTGGDKAFIGGADLKGMDEDAIDADIVGTTDPGESHGTRSKQWRTARFQSSLPYRARRNVADRCQRHSHRK